MGGYIYSSEDFSNDADDEGFGFNDDNGGEIVRGLEEEPGSMLVEPSERILVPEDSAITPTHRNSEAGGGIHPFAGGLSNDADEGDFGFTSGITSEMIRESEDESDSVSVDLEECVPGSEKDAPMAEAAAVTERTTNNDNAFDEDSNRGFDGGFDGFDETDDEIEEESGDDINNWNINNQGTSQTESPLISDINEA